MQLSYSSFFNKLYFLIIILLYFFSFRYNQTVFTYKHNVNKKIKVCFINVINGDSIFIDIFGKIKILIDAGDRSFKVTQNNKCGLSCFLNSNNIKHIDYFILTHPHRDHIGGILSLLDTLKIKYFIDTGYSVYNKEYISFIDYISKYKKTKYLLFKYNDLIKVNNVFFDFIYPYDSFLYGTKSDVNNNSLVIKLVYNKVSFLLTGDIEYEAEDYLLYNSSIRNINLKSTILKVPHHGSSTSSSFNFINKVRPELAIITNGINNKVNPSLSTLRMYNRLNIKYYTTSLDGSVCISTNGLKYEVEK